MKSIDIKTFTSDFMAISKNLTLAEIRLLYLLITEPNVIKISRQGLASKVGMHRRTVWLAFEKFKKYKYLSTESEEQNIKLSDNNSVINKDYDKLFYNYSTKREDKYFIRMIEEFPNNIPNTLDSFKSNLPQSIDDIAKKFSFEKALNIVKISIREIGKNKDDEDHYYNGLVISHKYKAHLSEQTKRKIIKKAIIFQPFNIQKLIMSGAGEIIDEATEFARYYSKKIYNVELEELINMGG